MNLKQDAQSPRDAGPSPTASILQLTDLHLLADGWDRHKNVPTRETLRMLIAERRRDFENADVIVVTGDCAHDEREPTYVALRELLGEFVARCLFVPGNHDSRPFLRAVFGDRIPSSEADRITFSQPVGDWQLIGLDSFWRTGEGAGRIDMAQIDWLDNELIECRERPVGVFLHHPPIKIGVDWLDMIRLRDSDLLLEVVTGHQNVRFVSAGHVHQEFTGTIGNAAFFTSPSTAVQFRSDVKGYSNEAPGFRCFELNGGDFQTRVVRLAETTYPPTQ